MRVPAAIALVLVAVSVSAQSSDPAIAAQEALSKCERTYIACGKSCMGAACEACEQARSTCKADVHANLAMGPPAPGGKNSSTRGTGSAGTVTSCRGSGKDGKECVGDTNPCTFDLCRGGRCVSTRPSVQTTLSPTLLFITAEPRMPPIRARAQIAGIEPDPTADAQFRWTFTISYTAPFGRLIELKLPSVIGPASYTPSFNTIRGGTLIARATLVRDGSDCGAAGVTAEIRGTNPPFADIKAAFGGNDVLARMACHESGRKLQFVNGKPLIEGGGGRGVGIMQLTNPPASDEAFWNWKKNVQEGLRIYNEKRAAFEKYYNAMRAQKPPAPPLTEQQKRQDIMTRYNGGSYWKYRNGKWVADPPLHPLKQCNGKKAGQKVTLNAAKGTWDICRSYYQRVMEYPSCE
jgi:hypothetical protein